MSTKAKKKKEENPNAFNVRLKTALKEKRMTRVQLAFALNVSEFTINSYCQGRSEPPIETIKKIAEVLEVSAGFLLGMTTIRNGEKSADVVLDDVIKTLREALREKYNRNFLLEYRNGLPRFSFGRCKMGDEDIIYPRDDDMHKIARTFGETPERYVDKYVAGKNIYRDSDVYEDVNTLAKFYGADISIYDYVNDGNSLTEFKIAYEAQRNSWGDLGALSADDFYKLNYIFGYFMQD